MKIFATVEKNVIRIDSAKKPLFLNTICDNPKEFEDPDKINSATILKVLTEEWIQHDILQRVPIKDQSTTNTTITIKQRQDISQILAVEETKTNKPISLMDISKAIENFQPNNAAKLDIEKYFKDAITSTFLSSETDNTFRFILKPICEYFVACSILDDIKSKNIRKIIYDLKVTLTPEIFEFISNLIKTRWTIKSRTIKQIQKLDVKEKNILKEISNDSQNVIEILEHIQQDKNKDFVGILVRILTDTANLPTKMNLSNLVISIPQYSSITNFRGVKLRESDLSGADLSGADLSGADLSGADLRGSDLSDAYLKEADLSETDLGDANLKDAYLNGTNLSGVKDLPILREDAKKQGAIVD